jgi:hypothetical protein
LTLDTGDLVFENGESITNNTDGTVAVTDGTNNLLTIVDAGTVGNVTATGSFTANGAGDFDTTLNIDGALTANGTFTLGDNGDTGIINTSDWDIGATGDMTGIGALTMDGNFSQTGATTFSTGTGAISLNGATSVTGTNTFSVGTGTTTLGGLLNVTGNTTLTGDLAVNGGDITSTSTTLNLVVGNTGTTAFTDGTNTLCSIIDNGTTGNFNCTGNASIDGDVTLGNAAGDVLTFTGTIAGATPFTFEGATADTFETSFAFVDPTADQTITFPDATGTVILDSTLDDTAFINGGNSFGAAAVLGTNDNNTLSFETNGATAATFSTAGELDMLNNFIENIGDAGTDFTAGGGLTLAGTLTANGTVILGDGGDTIAFNSSDWDINATGDMTGIGAITADGNFSQTGATTFSTGTGAISMNGATSVTGTNTFTVGTGTTTLGGTLAANGQVTLGDNGDTVTIDSSDWNVSATGDMTGIGSIAADGGYTQTGAGQNTFSGNVDATSGLDVTGANLTVGGANFSVSQANGNITSAGDLAVNGGDISTTGTALVMTVGNTGAFTFSDGTNTLCTMTDAGTTGDLTCSGSATFVNQTLSGDLAVNGGDITSTSPLTIDGTGTLTLADNVTQSGAGTFTTGTGLFTASGDATVTGTTTMNGNTVIGDAAADMLTINSSILGGTALTFEGTTADAFETFFAFTDPTADNTITFPDQSGDVLLGGNDSVDWDDIADAMTLDASTTSSMGANTLSFNLDGAGDFLIQDNGATFVTFADDGSTTFANDIAVNGGDITSSSATLTIDAGSTIAFADDLSWTTATPTLAIANGEVMTITDGTNTLFTLTDAGTTGNLAISGDTTVNGNTTLGNATTDTTTINGATTISSGGNTPLSLTRTSSGQFIGATDGTDTFGVYNRAGSPEGNITADAGSLAIDTTSGALYVKTDDGDNTDWQVFTTSANAWVLGGNSIAADQVLGSTSNFDVQLQRNGTNYLVLNNTAIDVSEDFVPTADNALDLGIATTNRFRTGYFGTSVVVGATTTITDGAITQSTSGLGDLTLSTTGGTSGDITLSSFADLFLDSTTTGTVALGDGNSAKTISIANGTAANTVNIATENTVADTITVGSALDSLAITGANFSLATNGNITTAGDVAVNGGDITSSAATLVLNAGGTVDIQDNLTADALTLDTGDLVFENGESITNNTDGTVAVTDGTNNLLTIVDAGTVGNVTATGSFTANGAGDFDTTLNIDGALTANGTFTLGDNGDTGIINTSDWDIGATGDMTGIGALTMDGNFSQTGATTFSTGTGAISLNGATSVTGTNTFSVGTGTTTLGGLLNVTGNTTLTGDLAVNGGDITSTSTTLNLVVGNTGTTAFTDGTNTLCSIIDNGTTGNFNCTGNASIDGDVTLGNAAGDVLTFTGTIAGATPFTFEGATADTFETSFAFVDPTADQTITFPDATGTVILDSTLDDTAFINGGNSFGAAAVLGTNDNNTLSFETNGATAATFSTAGELDMLNNFIENIGDAGTDFTAGGGLTLAGTLTANGTVILGDGGDTIAFNSSDWDINATGDMTGIGAITADGNFSQTGATTFSTGTGAISMNGATSVTGTNTFTVGTGTTTLGGTLAANGQVTLGDNGDTVTIDSSDWNVSATGDMTGIGSIAADGGYTQTGAGQNTFSGNVDATSGLDVTGANLTVGGANFSVSQANGNITSAGDLAVNGGDISTTGTALVMTVGNTGAFTFSDGTNTLCTMTDAGTTGDLTCSGSATFVNQTLSGDLAVNGGDITSTSPLTIDGTGTLTLADNVTQSGAGTFTTGTGLFTASGDATVTGTTTMNGNTVIGDAAADTLTINSSILGGTALTFEGTTTDAFETFFAFTDPTADNTITFPDQSGDVLLGGNDSINWDDIADAMTLDASTTSSMGANTLSFNLDGAGDFLIQDNGATFVTFADDGSTTFANDIAVNGGDITSSSATLTIDAGSTIAFADDLSWTTATPTLAIANGEVMTITDGTNTLFTLTDAGTTGNLAISGDTTVNGNTTLGNATTDTTTINGATTISSGANTPLSLTRTSSRSVASELLMALTPLVSTTVQVLLKVTSLQTQDHSQLTPLLVLSTSKLTTETTLTGKYSRLQCKRMGTRWKQYCCRPSTRFYLKL